MIAAPIPVTLELAGMREGFPAAAQADSLCRAIGPRGAVLIVGVPTQTYLQTVRSFCDVPAAGGPTARPDDVSAIAQQTQAHGDQLFLLVNDPAVLKPLLSVSTAPDQMGLFSRVAYPHWDASLTGPPSSWGTEWNDLYLVRVLPGGFLQPVSRGEVIQ